MCLAYRTSPSGACATSSFRCRSTRSSFRLGVTLNQVVETTGNAQLVSPLTFLERLDARYRGFIEIAQSEAQVRHVFENFGTPKPPAM